TCGGAPVDPPALVAFVGGGDDFSPSPPIPGGGVAWFPLGPREVYVPPYRVSPAYVRNVNITHVTNITEVNVTNINVNNVNYVNRNVAGAVTAVNREAFVGGRAIRREAVVVRPRDVERVKVQTTEVENIRPRRESIVGADAGRGAVRRPPERVLERRVLARAPPPPPPPKLGDEGRPRETRQTLVRPAVQEGNRGKLRPAREGLPEARTVKPGDKPKARAAEGGSRDDARTRDDARNRDDRTDDRKARDREQDRNANERARSADRPTKDHPPNAHDRPKPPADDPPADRKDH